MKPNYSLQIVNLQADVKREQDQVRYLATLVDERNRQIHELNQHHIKVAQTLRQLASDVTTHQAALREVVALRAVDSKTISSLVKMLENATN